MKFVYLVGSGLGKSDSVWHIAGSGALLLKILEKLGLVSVLDDQVIGIFVIVIHLFSVPGNFEYQLDVQRSFGALFSLGLLAQLANVSRLFGPLPIQLGQVDQLERLSGQLSELDGVGGDQAGRFGHGSGEQKECCAVADRGTLVLAGRIAALGKVAVSDSAVFDQKLFQLELFAAAVHRTLVNLVFVLHVFLVFGRGIFEGGKFFVVQPAFAAKSTLGDVGVVLLGSCRLGLRVRQVSRVGVAAHYQLHQVCRLIGVPLVGRVAGRAARLARVFQVDVILAEYLNMG
ncbi:hypothetical protein BpHYR1_050758 [Brachionus plicatilis]|uniref:Uncharacterized protein n=1 Tax=Brachionus plicatilis TaxID=10195 RepID=A0A3M7P9F2_BRAPC|nr:hypothetical protein BpHYR1_050758 [Brachionus plicatilis]